MIMSCAGAIHLVWCAYTHQSIFSSKNNTSENWRACNMKGHSCVLNRLCEYVFRGVFVRVVFRRLLWARQYKYPLNPEKIILWQTILIRALLEASHSLMGNADPLPQPNYFIKNKAEKRHDNNACKHIRVVDQTPCVHNEITQTAGTCN